MKSFLLSITLILLSFSTLAKIQHDCLNIKFEDPNIQEEYDKSIDKGHCKVDYKIKYIDGKTVYEIDGTLYQIYNGKYQVLKQDENYIEKDNKEYFTRDNN